MGPALGLAAIAALALFGGAGKRKEPANVIDATPDVPLPRGNMVVGPIRVIKTAPKPAAKPVAKTAAKPAAKRAAKPVARPVARAAPAKPKPKQATVAKRVVTTAAKPAAKKQAQGTALTRQLTAMHPAASKPVVKVKAPPGTNLALAKQTAADVAAHIRNKGRKYNAAVLKQFQTRAGLKPDGLHGPLTVSALRYFGANPPPALFKGANAQYVPPTVGV